MTEVVVIGSGVAGALCAFSLAKRGIKVQVLEAGPAIDRARVLQAFTRSADMDFASGYPNPWYAPRPDWQVGRDHFIVHSGTATPTLEYLRVLGGTTWHWGGTALRLLPDDFRVHSLHGLAVDWPITYDMLEPYYTQAEYELGIAGDALALGDAPRNTAFPMSPITSTYAEKQLAAKLHEMGISFAPRPVARNSEPYDGRSQCQGFSHCSPLCPSGAQYSAMVHVEKARAQGVTFLTDTRVDRLRCDERGVIVGVDVQDKHGKKQMLGGTHFVLAANGIENARLLLLSADKKQPNGLANRSGLVGRFFCDHPGIFCRMRVPFPVHAGRGPESTLICHDFRNHAGRGEHAGWTLGITNRVRLHEISLDLLQAGLRPPRLDQEIQHRAQHEIEVDLQFEQLPDSNNHVLLDADLRDTAGQAAIRMHYSYGEYEQRGFAKGRELLQQMCRHLAVERFTISEPGTRHHLMGTTRMGVQPEHSVVDTQCRAHDHPNLHILGSSVFPSAGTANPTLTIAALSLRAADDIARDRVPR